MFLVLKNARAAIFISFVSIGELQLVFHFNYQHNCVCCSGAWLCSSMAMCYTSLTLNMLGTILTIATAALMLMFHPLGKAKARAIVKKILHKMCKC